MLSCCESCSNCLLRYYGLKPDIKVISPWREWDLNSRSKLIQYAEERGIPVPQSKRGEPPFSTDANLLHISYEGYTASLCMLVHLRSGTCFLHLHSGSWQEHDGPSAWQKHSVPVCCLLC